MEFINRFALGKVDYAITDFLDAVNWYHYLDLEGNYKASKNRSFRMEYTFDEEGVEFYLIETKDDRSTEKMIYHLKPEEYRYGVPKILEGLLKGYFAEWCGELNNQN